MLCIRFWQTSLISIFVIRLQVSAIFYQVKNHEPHPHKVITFFSSRYFLCRSFTYCPNFSSTSLKTWMSITAQNWRPSRSSTRSMISCTHVRAPMARYANNYGAVASIYSDFLLWHNSRQISTVWYTMFSRRDERCWVTKVQNAFEDMSWCQRRKTWLCVFPLFVVIIWHQLRGEHAHVSENRQLYYRFKLLTAVTCIFDLAIKRVCIPNGRSFDIYFIGARTYVPRGHLNAEGEGRRVWEGRQNREGNWGTWCCVQRFQGLFVRFADATLSFCNPSKCRLKCYSRKEGRVCICFRLSWPALYYRDATISPWFSENL